MTLASSEAEKLRRVVDHAKSASPNVAVFEAHQLEEDGDLFINFFHLVPADVQKAIKVQLRNEDNLENLRDFNDVFSHKFYPSDVCVGGENVVSISSRNFTFSR